jgi:CBS domain-containing protein
MGLFGLFAFNIILIGVAFFVYIAASSEAQQVTMKAAFQDVTVRDIMTTAGDLHTVEPDASVAELIQRMFTERHTGYPVVETDGFGGERLVGLVTLSDARDIKPVERDAYTVSEVMTTDLKTIEPDSDAMTAIERMREHGIGRLLVVDGRDEWGSEGGFGDPAPRTDGDLVGLISRSDVMTAFDIVQKSGSVNPSSQPRAGD